MNAVAPSFSDDEFTKHTGAIRAILDMLTVLSAEKMTDSLFEGTICNAAVTATEHLDALSEALRSGAESHDLQTAASGEGVVITDESRIYSDLQFKDDMDQHLHDASTLADLLAGYSPSDDGQTAYGSTVQHAGEMLNGVLYEACATFKRWKQHAKQERREARGMQS